MAIAFPCHGALGSTIKRHKAITSSQILAICPRFIPFNFAPICCISCREASFLIFSNIAYHFSMILYIKVKQKSAEPAVSDLTTGTAKHLPRDRKNKQSAPYEYVQTVLILPSRCDHSFPRSDLTKLAVSLSGNPKIHVSKYVLQSLFESAETKIVNFRTFRMERTGFYHSSVPH